MNHNSLGTEIEDGSSLYSSISYSRDEGVSVNALTRSSEEKNIQLPFNGFIQNLGQLKDDSIKYYYSTNDLSIGFGLSTIFFTTKPQEEIEFVSFSISFPNSDPVIPMGRDKANHSINYFYNNLQLTNVPTWEEIWYYNLYPGIDLRYYISNQGLKYDFNVHPDADPNQIAVQLSNSMTLSVENDNICFQAPSQSKRIWFQDTALRVLQADNTVIPACFIPKTTNFNTYGFQIGSFDPTQTLIIDPLLLSFSTYLGGNDYDFASEIAVDNEGNSYITGSVFSSNFPTVNPFQSTHAGGSNDVVVAKLNATGNGLVFSTYLGGSSEEFSHGITVDTDGNCYVTGRTESSDFPTTPNAFNNSLWGSSDMFVVKLNATGNMIYSTFVGGNDFEAGHAIAVDSVGNAYITGKTFRQSNFPLKNPYQDTHGGGSYDAFVTKLNATGNGLIFSTYLGGNSGDEGNAIVVDNDGNSFITGYTKSDNFPTYKAYNSTFGLAQDVFITKLNATGNGLVFSTYLGGKYDDIGHAIAVDDAGNTYITGETTSSNFPLQAPYQSSYKGESDVFVTKLNSTGTGLNFSTYISGSGDDFGYGIAVDNAGNSYITGITQSFDFPITWNAYQNTSQGYDAFLANLDVNGSNLIVSSFLGGNNEDTAFGIAVKGGGTVYIGGWTGSDNFPTTSNAYQSDYYAFSDFFISKLIVDVIPPSITLVSPANGSTYSSGIIIDLIITDDESGLDQVLCNWDGSANATLASPHNVPLPAGDGEHVLHVYASDQAENWASIVCIFTTKDPTTTSISSTSSTTPYVSDIFTMEIFLIAIASLGLVLWRKRKVTK
ncbi:MAG: SBBP repeat-containing protein [Candidatus Hermodarchaeota archaeon]